MAALAGPNGQYASTSATDRPNHHEVRHHERHQVHTHTLAAATPGSWVISRLIGR